MKIKGINNPANNLFVERSSIRKYDTSVKISKEEMSNIIQDAMTAPSSLNLQPWRFVVIDSPKGKELIKPYMAFNELQHETSSAIIAVFADLNCAEKTEDILSAGVEHQLVEKEYKDKMLGFIGSYLSELPKDKLMNSLMLDCGFVAMQLMLSAKAYGYDTNPIGAFDRENLPKVLGMDANKYLPVLLISIGKADEKAHDSIRFSVEEITQWK